MILLSTGLSKFEFDAVQSCRDRHHPSCVLSQLGDSARQAMCAYDLHQRPLAHGPSQTLTGKSVFSCDLCDMEGLGSKISFDGQDRAPSRACVFNGRLQLGMQGPVAQPLLWGVFFVGYLDVRVVYFDLPVDSSSSLDCHSIRGCNSSQVGSYAFWPDPTCGLLTDCLLLGTSSAPCIIPLTLTASSLTSASSVLVLLKAFYTPECAFLLPSVHTKGGLSLACGLLATFEAMALAFLPLLSYFGLDLCLF